MSATFNEWRPSFNEHFKALIDVLETAKDAIEAGRTLPALILIYSAIDAVASLEKRERESSRGAFLRWVDSYLLPGSALECSALELYAARCSLLHTFGSQSHLSQTGRVRQIVYAWGTGDASKLQRLIDAADLPGIALNVSDLMKSFRHGVAKMLEQTADDKARLNQFRGRLDSWFAHMPISVVESWDSQLDAIRERQKKIKNTK